MVSLTAREWLWGAWVRAEHPKRSEVTPGNCVYDPGVEGGCFIGCSLGDEYTQRLEGWDAHSAVHAGFLAVSDLPVKEARHFLSTLQGIHDNTDPGIWHEALESFGFEYGIQLPASSSWRNPPAWSEPERSGLAS